MNLRYAAWPASPRSPKSVGPKLFSLPEQVHQAVCLVQPGVQPELRLTFSWTHSLPSPTVPYWPSNHPWRSTPASRPALLSLRPQTLNCQM